MWLPPLASRAENLSSISFNRGLTVHDRLTEHLGKRQWIHPKDFSCCSGIGATWAAFILRAGALCCACPWSSWADPGACGSFIPTSRLSCLATRPRGLEHLSSWPHRESSSFALHPPGTSCQSQDPELFYISTALAGPFTLNWVKDESRELRVPEGPVCWFLNILLSLSDNSGLCITSLWSCQT